ncbi:MAG: hypothetical protein COB19_06785 [Porticoccus sp.]|nr:MAG: hypothetical protein COB19_06785 [Porticoccus sp.]
MYLAEFGLAPDDVLVLVVTCCFSDYFPGDCLDNERRSSISRAVHLATSRYIALNQLRMLKYLPLSI